MRSMLLVVGAVAATLAAGAPAALADVNVNDRTYVSPTTGVPTADRVLADCSVDRRQQNEPTVAVDPGYPSHVTAGSNDYCTVPNTGDAWGGWYWSADAGATWTDSLLPGYPGDATAEGRAAATTSFVGNTGDPVQAWDLGHDLYYGVIGFNRVRPQNGSLFVYKFHWDPGEAMPRYVLSRLVRAGAPTPGGQGHFEDKIQIQTDTGVNSPYQGNVYVCNARFTGSAVNNPIVFYRSTDGGQTWSNGTKLSEQVHGAQFCDVAVTSDGTVYVAWRQYAYKKQQQDAVDYAVSTDGGRTFGKPIVATPFVHWDAVDYAVSTDGGRTFGKPIVATTFVRWDAQDTSGSPAAAEEQAHESCLAGDFFEPDACGDRSGRAPETAPGDARDCGDGPFACQDGYVFFRVDSQVRIAADPTDTAHPKAAYVVYNATVPGTETDSDAAYGTVRPGVASQGAIYFTKTATGQPGDWTAPARIDPQAKGNQWFPDLDARNGQLRAVWQDSRLDCANGRSGSWLTAPISNLWVAANPPGAVACGAGVGTWAASSTTAGGEWTTRQVSSVLQMPQYEQFGDRDVPFFGDYNFVSTSGTGVTVATWTDQRDTLPGADPRYPLDGTDGFEVHQCRTQAADGSWSADACPNDGGLNQNVYAGTLP